MMVIEDEQLGSVLDLLKVGVSDGFQCRCGPCKGHKERCKNKHRQKKTMKRVNIRKKESMNALRP